MGQGREGGVGWSGQGRAGQGRAGQGRAGWGSMGDAEGSGDEEQARNSLVCGSVPRKGAETEMGPGGR